MQKCEKARNINRVIYISYTLSPQFSSFSGILSAVVERQILKTLYQFHRLLLHNRRLKFLHAPDISYACKKYIISTAKIQGRKHNAAAPDVSLGAACGGPHLRISVSQPAWAILACTADHTNRHCTGLPGPWDSADIVPAAPRMINSLADSLTTL